jgi:hypothetical protein
VAREWAHDALNSVEPYGILVTAGDNDTFPLWYAQEVEGVRPDVTIAVTSLLNTDWYARALLRRPIVPYDAERGPAAYRGKSWAMPTRPILSLSIEELNAIPDYIDVREPQIFQQGALRAVVDPRRLEYGVPVRSDILVLQMLKDNMGVRPVYIGRTSGAYAQALGLEPYSLVQGLVTKIMSGPVAAGGDTIAMPGLGFLDLGRSRALWRGYEAPASIVRRGDWVDRPSVGIAAIYTSTGLMLAAAAEATGDSVEAAGIRASAMNVALAAHTLEWFVGAAPSAPAAVSLPAGEADVPRSTALPVRP